MIRRNHIGSVTKIDRKTLQSREKRNYQNRYAYKKEPETTFDENYRAMSSNKKYHQYKGWKEQSQNKAVDNQVQDAWRERNALQQFDVNEANLRSKVEMEYQAELDEVFKRQYLISKVQPQKPNIRNQKNPPAYRYLRDKKHKKISFDQNMQLPLKKESVNSHQISYENSITRSPPRHRSSYQSTRKPSGLNYQYPLSQSQDQPLFAQQLSGPSHFQQEKHDRVINNPQLPNNAHKKTGKIVGYKQTIKTLHEEKKQNVNSFNLASSRRQQYEPSFRDNFKYGSQPVGDGGSFDERVGGKLKMISDFNDQINERIKNIIVCFEELRTRI